MKTFKIIIMVLTMSVMHQFTYAQPNCHGDNVLMATGTRGCGCSGCMQKCVPASDVPAYLAKGWYLGECFKCCNNWVSTDATKGTKETKLTAIHPNTDSGSFNISFNLSEESEVSIKVFDLTGRYVATVTNDIFEDEGSEVDWDASGIIPGIYFLKLKAGNYSETQKISVLN